MHREPNLPEVVLAFGEIGLFPDFLNGGQNQGDECPDNGNHDQEFDQREASAAE